MPEWRCPTCAWRVTTAQDAPPCPHVVVILPYVANDLITVAAIVTAHLSVHPPQDLFAGSPVRTCFCARSEASLGWTLGQVTRQTGYIAASPPGGATLQARRLKVLMADVLALAVIYDLAHGASSQQVAAARGIPLADFEALYGPWWQRWQAGEDYPWRPEFADGFADPRPR